MTTDNSTSNEQGNNSAPLFEHFQWHRKEMESVKVPGHLYADLAGKVRDIASGCATILELIEFDYLQGAAGERPMMSAGDAGNLTRLAIQSLNMLNDNADESMAWVNDYYTEAGKTDRAKGGN